MAKKTQVVYENRLYYSMSTTAKLLGTTVPMLKKIMVDEGLEWKNFKVNGPIWVGAESINSFLKRKKLKKD